MLKSLLSIWDFISLKIIANIQWGWLKARFNSGRYYEITDEELNTIRALLKNTNCIGVSRRKTHLTTYLIAVASFIATGTKSYWTHAFMNTEGDVLNDEDFLLVEATGRGFLTSSFMEVFDCDSVCLLIPKNFTIEKWATVCEKIPSIYGTPYDTLFKYKDTSKLSCIEAVRELLKAEPDYLKDFPNFEAMIKEEKNLTPQMLFDCPDFQRILLIKH